MATVVKPGHITYAVEEAGKGDTLLGISVPAYGHGGVHVVPADWSRVNLVVHGVAPIGAPVLVDPDADPTLLESWVLPAIGSEDWDRHTEEWHTVEDPQVAERKWHRLHLRAAFLERYLDVENVRADLLAEAVRRADRLGWRSISMRRLVALAGGDDDQLPPEV